MTARTRAVVTDACVLINLSHVGRLTLLGELPGFEFVIPDHVYEEVTDPEQRRMEGVTARRRERRRT